MSRPIRTCLLAALSVAGLSAGALAQEAFTPGHVFLGNDEGEVWEVTPEGEVVETFTLDDDEAEVLALAFGADGRLLGLLDNGKLVALTPDGEVADLVETDLSTTEGGLAVAPDGDILVQASNALRRFDPVSGAAGDSLGLDDANSNETGGLVFGPGGQLFVLANESNAATRRTVLFEYDPAYEGVTETLLDPSFSPPVGGLVATPEGDLFCLLPNLQQITKVEIEDDGVSVEELAFDGLTDPRALAVGPAGNLWVSDPDVDTVFVLDDEGELVTTFDDGDAFEGILSIATAPYRFRAAVKGELWVDEEDTRKVKLKQAELSVAPGLGTVMLWLGGGPEDAELREAFGGSRGWVLRGVEHAAGEQGKRRLLQAGLSLWPDVELGDAQVSLRLDGSTDEESELFTLKKAAGTLYRSSPDGAFRARVKASRSL